MNFWELFMILLVALVVIKPERLPEITYTLGRVLGKIQRLYHKLLEKYQPNL